MFLFLFLICKQCILLPILFTFHCIVFCYRTNKIETGRSWNDLNVEVNRNPEHEMSPHKVCTCKKKRKRESTMCTFISVNMLLWRPSTSVPSMLWLQFKWQMNRYVNGYLLCSKGTRCPLCMLHDCILKPLDPQIPWLGGFLRGLSEKTTENTNTGGRQVKSRWMDVVKKEVRSADVQIKDEAVLVPSFPLEAAGWPRVQGAQTNECVEEVRITPPSSSNETLSLIRLHLHLCLHLNNHLLHAPQLHREREKKWIGLMRNKAMNFTRWRRGGRKGSSNPYESLLGKWHSNNIHCELKAKSKSIFTTHSNCRTNSLNG